MIEKLIFTYSFSFNTVGFLFSFIILNFAFVTNSLNIIII
nr:MAG TPA: hypothetical protein [Caudoviricetes sp.]